MCERCPSGAGTAHTPASTPTPETLDPATLTKGGDPLVVIPIWELAEKIAMGSTVNVLLYGPPGTGKTTLGHQVSAQLGMPLYVLNCTAETSAAEARGHYINAGDRGFVWINGPAVSAMLDPGILLINEIDHAGPDLQSFLHAICDAKDRAVLTLPDEVKTQVRPKKGFRVIATMNGEPDSLGEALADRFSVKMRIGMVNPRAIEALPMALRPFVSKIKELTGKTNASIRSLFDFAEMEESAGVVPAAQAIFGAKWQEFLVAYELAKREE